MKTAQERLYHFEETPPAEMWEKIAGNINQGKVVSLQSRKRTKRTAFITVAAAVAAILLINFIFINKSKDQPAGNQIAAVDVNDSMEKNFTLLESIINAPDNKKLITSKNISNVNSIKYFTVEGPEGEPVKISPKAATLIISADNDFPPKPVWDEKINEWQHIMLTNNISATSMGLFEMIQQASTNIR